MVISGHGKYLNITKYMDKREQWNLAHPNDEIPTLLGIDGQYIPERYIPFPTENLISGDMLYSEDGDQILYIEKDKSYVLVVDNPSGRYLSTPFKTWKEYKVG